VSAPREKKDTLRILFWNVQDWDLRSGGPVRGQRRFDRILSILRREKPDIALFAEVQDPGLKNALVRGLGNRHSAFETNDKNPRQLLAVFNAAAGRSVIATQRNEFAGDDMSGRAFPLLEVQTKTGALAIMAAHTKARSNPESMKKRQYQLGQIAAVAAAFNARGVPLLVMGDMNSMGNGLTIDGPREITIMNSIMASSGLTALPKDRPHTWRGIDSDARYPDAELDHAFISASAAALVRPVNDNGAVVRVGGWPELDTKRRQNNWVRRHSDHAYLVMDIKLPG